MVALTLASAIEGLVPENSDIDRWLAKNPALWTEQLVGYWTFNWETASVDELEHSL